MRNRILFSGIAILIMGCSEIIAQTENWQWVTNTKSYWGMCNDMAVDSNGNIYIAGQFVFSDFDLLGINLINHGDEDSYVAKFDNSGNIIWARSFGGPDLDEIQAIDVDQNGNVYIAGYYESPTLNFDAFTLINSGHYDVFISKLDNSGNVLWAKSFGGTDYEIDFSVKCDLTGSIYITGYYLSSQLIIESFVFNNQGSNDIFLIKYDTDGNLIWARSFGGQSGETSNDMSFDSYNNLYLTGRFWGDTMQFDAESIFNTTGYPKMFVTKFNPSGVAQWAKTCDNCTGYHWVSKICTDHNDNIYLGGTLSNNCNITIDNYSLINQGNDDIFLVKLNSSGGTLWAKNEGGINSESLHDITVDHNNNLVMTGYVTSRNITIGPYILTNQSDSASDMGSYWNWKDFVIAQYASNGTVTWANIYGNRLDEEANELVSGPDGIIIAGEYESDTFNIGPFTVYDSSSVFTSMFVAKFSIEPNKVDLLTNRNNFSLYPNPNKGKFTVSYQTDMECYYEIYDLLGKQTCDKKSFRNSVQIDLSGKPKGMYILKLYANKEIKVVKVLLQ